jgi:hypothetical protein
MTSFFVLPVAYTPKSPEGDFEEAPIGLLTIYYLFHFLQFLLFKTTNHKPL